MTTAHTKKKSVSMSSANYRNVIGFFSFAQLEITNYNRCFINEFQFHNHQNDEKEILFILLLHSIDNKARVNIIICI
jgi:hypothetical protein